MYTLFAIFALFFGVCIGSFLNVVVLRHNTGLGLSRERSMCFTCGRQIPWYENVPLLSFVFLRGKCGACKSRISLQYPLVELLTGLLFLGVWFAVVPIMSDYEILQTETLLSIFITILYFDTLLSLLIVILVYDIKHKIIPDAFVYSFSLISLGGLVFMNISDLRSVTFIWDLVSGFLFFVPFYILWRVSDGRWIGLGDGKLALGIGWMLGLVYGLSAIVLAFWIGAGVSILLLGLDRVRESLPCHWSRLLPNISMKSEIPFAPFLILGVIVEFFWKIDVIGITSLL